MRIGCFREDEFAASNKLYKQTETESHTPSLQKKKKGEKGEVNEGV